MKFYPFSRVLTCITTSLIISASSAQTGPGGIQDTTGSSSLILWLDANAIEGKNNYNTVSTWYDQSGYKHDASQTVIESKPNYLENFLNGLPVLNFNGNSTYLQGLLLNGTFNAPNTVIVVPYFDILNMPSDDNGYIMSIGSSGSSHNHFSIARRKSSGGNGNRYYSWVNDASPKLGDSIPGQRWNIITQVNSSSAPYHYMYLNGNASTVDAYSTAVQSNGTFRIGQWYFGGNNTLDGRLAEVIVFNKVLNAAELNIIHAYLAGKYDLSVAGDIYLGDDAVNGDNDLTIAGIGQESDGSNTLAKSDGLSLEIADDFEDGDYVMFGHNVLENSVNTTDVNGSITSRWDRSWWLDITNSGDEVNCNFTFSQTEGEIGFGGLHLSDETDYKLIYKSTPAGSWSIVATASSVKFNQVKFDNVNLSNDGYYTLGTIDDNSQVGISPVMSTYKGPGGVGEIDGTSNLKLWYNIGDMMAEDGDLILSLEDFSGNENDAVQLQPLNLSSFNKEVLNQKGAAEFNGANTYLSNTLNFAVNTPLVVFCVGYFNKINQANDDNDYIYSIGDGLSRGDQLSLSRRKANDEDDVANINRYYSWDGDTARFGDVIDGQTWNIFTQEFFSTGSSKLHNAFINGSDANPIDNETEAQPNSNLFSIGRWNNNDHWLDGMVSELILFNRELNTAERYIVQSYLSGKYNLPVSNDKYTGDDPANGDNDKDIAGVGTEADGSNTGANSAGLIIEQVSGFTTGDYVMVGHAVDTNLINEIDAVDNTGTNEARWERTWYFDITNTSDNPVVNLSFDFSDVNAKSFPGSEENVYYTLLFRSGSSGIWTKLNDTPTINGDQVVFNNVELTNDGFYTLGTSNSNFSPLPVTLVKFNAKNLVNSVLIEWETASEINCESFVLEKSENTIHYQKIYETQGAGTSMESHSYSFIDTETVKSKTAYYQLVQKDFNGAYEVFGPIAINYNFEKNKITVFPNPAKDFIIIIGLKQPSTIKLKQLDGKQLLTTKTTGETKVQLSTSKLETGFYILQIENIYETETVKIIIR